MKRLSVGVPQWAQTIINQLGGNKFIVMTGAKQFIFSEKDKFLRFKIGRNAGKVNLVKIYLLPSDTYRMEFGRTHGQKYKILKEFDLVYADQLVPLFEKTTGMHTKLF